MNLYTIGFRKKSAQEFFGKLLQYKVKKILDIRLNNVSQLAGYTKRNDFEFFLKTICHIDYCHLPDLAPTQEILDEFKKNKGSWQVYEVKFNELIRVRQIEKIVTKELLSDACLLCSEPTSEHCHRRLVAEYLQIHFPNIKITHIP